MLNIDKYIIKIKGAIKHIRTYNIIIDIKSLTTSDIWHNPIVIHYNITDRLSITLSSQTYIKLQIYTNAKRTQHATDLFPRLVAYIQNILIFTKE